MKWKSINIDLGILQEKVVKKFTFEYFGDKNIKKVNPGCSSCTKVTFKDKKIFVKYSVGSFPRHILESSIFVRKTIVVHYEDTSFETLSFTAKILRK